jgi:hypothetical protein
MQIIVTMKSGKVVKGREQSFEDAWAEGQEQGRAQLGDQFTDELLAEKMAEYIQSIVEPLENHGVKNLATFKLGNEDGTHYFHIDNIDYVTVIGLEEMADAIHEKIMELQEAE